MRLEAVVPVDVDEAGVGQEDGLVAHGFHGLRNADGIERRAVGGLGEEGDGLLLAHLAFPFLAVGGGCGDGFDLLDMLRERGASQPVAGGRAHAIGIGGTEAGDQPLAASRSLENGLEIGAVEDGFDHADLEGGQGRIGNRLAIELEALRSDLKVVGCIVCGLGHRARVAQKNADVGPRGLEAHASCDRNEIVLADEAGDERVRRAIVDVPRAADLLDTAVIEHGDAVGEPERLLLVVRHDDEGYARVLLRTLELHLHLLAQAPVERGEGLVEKQHLRLLDKGAGERHALALAAGKLVRLAVPERSPIR